MQLGIRRRRDEGQVLPIFVGGLFALILGVAIVVDGGNAMAQQRDTQKPQTLRQRRARPSSPST